MHGFLPGARHTTLYTAFPYDPWLVPGLIPTDSVVVLASSPKVGKTAFATALARAVSVGGEFLGHQLKQHPVLWCAHEETPPERVRLHEGMKEEAPFFIAYSDSLPALDDPQGESRRDRFGRYDERIMPYVFDEARERGAGLIVIDSLHAAVRGGDLSNNSFARHTMEKLVGWCYHFHCAVLVLHHLTKSAPRGYQPERIADSGQILASANAHFFMERHESKGNVRRFTLHGEGRHPEPIRTLELESPNILEYRVATKSSEPKLTQADRLLQFFETSEQATVADAAEALEIRLASAKALVSKLVRTGELIYMDQREKARVVARV